MPTYIFENEKGEVFERFMKISEADAYLKNNPNIKRRPTAPNIVSATGDRVRPAKGFQEVLSRVAEANPYSKLADSHGKKDAQSVAKRNIAKKARKKLET